MSRRADEDLAARLVEVGDALTFFGYRVERVVRRMEVAMARLENRSRAPVSLAMLSSVHKQLRAAARMALSRTPRTFNLDEDLELAEYVASYFDERLEILTVALRDATTMCSTTFVVPKPVEDLIAAAEELSSVRRWWLAVRSGGRSLSDGPPDEC